MLIMVLRKVTGKRNQYFGSGMGWDGITRLGLPTESRLTLSLHQGMFVIGSAPTSIAGNQVQ